MGIKLWGENWEWMDGGEGGKMMEEDERRRFAKMVAWRRGEGVGTKEGGGGALSAYKSTKSGCFGCCLAPS
jgi:hypothetical protein